FIYIFFFYFVFLHDVLPILLIRIFYVLGLNIFVLHFLMNGPRKEMENLFLKNQIFHHNYLISFLGNKIYTFTCCTTYYIIIIFLDRKSTRLNSSHGSISYAV